MNCKLLLLAAFNWHVAGSCSSVPFLPDSCSSVASKMHWHLKLLFSQCRTLLFSLLNFIRFLSFHFFHFSAPLGGSMIYQCISHSVLCHLQVLLNAHSAPLSRSLMKTLSSIFPSFDEGGMSLVSDFQVGFLLFIRAL